LSCKKYTKENNKICIPYLKERHSHVKKTKYNLRCFKSSSKITNTSQSILQNFDAFKIFELFISALGFYFSTETKVYPFLQNVIIGYNYKNNTDFITIESVHLYILKKMKGVIKIYGRKSVYFSI